MNDFGCVRHTEIGASYSRKLQPQTTAASYSRKLQPQTAVFALVHGQLPFAFRPKYAHAACLAAMSQLHLN
jgi:hypothetical protein